MHIALLIAEHGYFLSHRLSLAQAAVRAGYTVTVITTVPAGVTAGTWPGVEIAHLDLPRGMGTPVADLRALLRLTRILRKLRPALIQNVSVKLVLLGTLAAWIAGVPRILNAYTGLGTLFHAPSWRVRCVRAAVVPLLARLVRRTGAWALFQNTGDQSEMLRLKLAAPDRCALVCGTGVDTAHFHPTPEPEGEPVVLFVGRLLEDKGIGEFVQAATMLRRKGMKARFLAAGEPDPENPRSIPAAVLDEWRRSGPVEWLGQVTDMPALLSRSHIICLPSYHEGTPRVLLEAAASGRPVVAADIAGCRSVVKENATGLLVPVRDADALGAALERLIQRPDLRRVMGENARREAVARFAAPIINEHIIALYQRMVQT
ncbi:MAG: glycosyltransferase family 4 protein [Gammaproteobacteria bacterium]|nr:glycosyltransferase family 4 protein [Gammaproteobacteria bacterium]